MSNERLFEIQADMVTLTKAANSNAEAVRNVIAKNPLCIEAVTLLESLERGAEHLYRLVQSYRQELKQIAKEERRRA